MDLAARLGQHIGYGKHLGSVHRFAPRGEDVVTLSLSVDAQSRDPPANPLCNSFYPSGFNPASIWARRDSRNGGSASFSPSVSIGSSVAKPGPSVAISNRMPLGSRKYRLRK